MNAYSRLLALTAAAGAVLMPSDATRAQLLITGNDEKVTFDENTGMGITHPAGKETVSIMDTADPAKPRIVVNLPLMNTITGGRHRYIDLGYLAVLCRVAIKAVEYAVSSPPS